MTDSYDSLPYASGPFAETHPVNLALLGRLFGLAAPDPERARVLELGCASGGNLIPMAFHLPRASFLGIELSAAQAQAGADFVRELRLDNIRIEQGDVAAVADGIGEFANGPDLMEGRTSATSRASVSARSPADVQDARMPRRPAMAESGLGPIGEATTAPSLTRGPADAQDARMSRRPGMAESGLGPIGEFDYIIAHGLYSWVPAAVREKILALCARHLSPHGIAYVSFNTLPGWRMRGMLRDMLLFSTRSVTVPAARLATAQAFLDSLGRSLEGLDALHAEYLRHELERIRGNHPSYLYHEYLEEVNEPLLFSDFAAAAGRHGLKYLCDADVQMMFPGDLGEAAPWLETITDPIEREQYMDFIRSRAFRGTLLCRADRAPAGDLQFDQLDRLAFHALLAPETRPDWRQVQEQSFATPEGLRCTVSHPLTRAALKCLAASFPDSVPAETLAAEAQRILLAAGNHAHAGEMEHMIGELGSLWVQHAVGLDLRARHFYHELPARPAATRLARLQAARGLGHLTTPRHAMIALDDFSARFVAALDGTRSRAQVIAGLGDRGPEGERLLALLARQGLLEAPAG